MSQINNPCVLVVDDDVAVLESCESLLKEQGYSVLVSGGSKDAMAKLRENNVDVVLTDVRMPEVSGIELLEQIHGFNSNIPVILMTAYAELDIAITAMGKGAFDFIIKPYKQELLLHALQLAVKHKRLIL